MEPNDAEDNLSEALEYRSSLSRHGLIFDWSPTLSLWRRNTTETVLGRATASDAAAWGSVLVTALLYVGGALLAVSRVAGWRMVRAAPWIVTRAAPWLVTRAAMRMAAATGHPQLVFNLFAAACCGCNPAAAATFTIFFSLWIAAAAVQTAATVSACGQPNTPFESPLPLFFSMRMTVHPQLASLARSTSRMAECIFCLAVFSRFLQVIPNALNMKLRDDLERLKKISRWLWLSIVDPEVY